MRLPRSVVVVLLIALPAVVRALQFERSLVPMGALALFCGAHFRSRSLALAIPLASMLLGDVLIGLFHHDMRMSFHVLMPVVYGCYALNVLMGFGLRHYWDALKSRRAWGDGGSQRDSSVLATRVLPIAGTTLAGALFFFLVTNFADWYFFDTYPKTGRGLLDCYTLAIPFFRRGTLLADVLGSALFFGAEALFEMQGAREAETERV
jgi:hypothetical protein